MRFDYDAVFLLVVTVSAVTRRSHNPATATPDSFNTATVWPHPLSLATTHGISLPVGTEMFHFPTFPPHTLYIQVRVTTHDCGWVPPFGNPRITVRLPTPRGLSQATTSFFGSWCQGIHPVPLNTSTKKITTQSPSNTHPQGHALMNIFGCSRPLYSSQATDDPTRGSTHLPHPQRSKQLASSQLQSTEEGLWWFAVTRWPVEVHPAIRRLPQDPTVRSSTPTPATNQRSNPHKRGVLTSRHTCKHLVNVPPRAPPPARTASAWLNKTLCSLERR